MSMIIIKDLDQDDTLDLEAMRAVTGGSRKGLSRLASSRDGRLAHSRQSRLIPGLLLTRRREGEMPQR